MQTKTTKHYWLSFWLSIGFVCILFLLFDYDWLLNNIQTYNMALHTNVFLFNRCNNYGIKLDQTFYSPLLILSLSFNPFDTNLPGTTYGSLLLNMFVFIFKNQLVNCLLKCNFNETILLNPSTNWNELNLYSVRYTRNMVTKGLRYSPAYKCNCWVWCWTYV